MSLMAFNLIYVIVFYELQHLQYNFFPEYKSYHNYDLREMVIKNFLQYAFKIITCVEKDKILLQKYYNALEDKIIVQPFVSRLPIIYEKKKEEVNFNNFFKKFEKTNKKILFYPAQFWPHKNHRYIIEAIESIVYKNKITDFHVVFCGFDKFHQLDFLKKIIKEKDISDYFSFYDYLEDEEIISLYLNSYALVMPTFVGHYSLPLFEAFYFKIPVFFTKNLLDENLRKYVFEIDTREPKLFYDKLKYLDENKDKVKDLTLSSHEFYKDFCSLKNIKKNYIKIFEDVEYFNNLWK
jgi:glycosyltransferase involved in cell wall biosynthesis